MNKLDPNKFEKELKEFLNDKLGDGNYDLNFEIEKDHYTKSLTGNENLLLATLSVWNKEIINYD